MTTDYLTVKQLREKLATYPDDMPVYLATHSMTTEYDYAPLSDMRACEIDVSEEEEEAPVSRDVRLMTTSSPLNSENTPPCL